MKNHADLRGCYPPRPSASVDNTLIDLLNSSYPTKAEFINCQLYTAHVHVLKERIVFSREHLQTLFHCVLMSKTKSEDISWVNIFGKSPI